MGVTHRAPKRKYERNEFNFSDLNLNHLPKCLNGYTTSLISILRIRYRLTNVQGGNRDNCAWRMNVTCMINDI